MAMADQQQIGGQTQPPCRFYCPTGGLSNTKKPPGGGLLLVIQNRYSPPVGQSFTLTHCCYWRPQGDSNPRRRRERAVSWASRRWGQNKLLLGGASEDRTRDLYNAIVALSQLSYGPATLSRE